MHLLFFSLVTDLHERSLPEEALERRGPALADDLQPVDLDVAEQRLGRLRSSLGYARIDEILAVGLHEYLDGFQLEANDVANAIFETFFALKPIDGERSRA